MNLGGVVAEGRVGHRHRPEMAAMAPPVGGGVAAEGTAGPTVTAALPPPKGGGDGTTRELGGVAADDARLERSAGSHGGLGVPPTTPRPPSDRRAGSLFPLARVRPRRVSCAPPATCRMRNAGVAGRGAAPDRHPAHAGAPRWSGRGNSELAAGQRHRGDGVVEGDGVGLGRASAGRWPRAASRAASSALATTRVAAATGPGAGARAASSRARASARASRGVRRARGIGGLLSCAGDSRMPGRTRRRATTRGPMPVCGTAHLAGLPDSAVYPRTPRPASGTPPRAAHRYATAV